MLQWSRNARWILLPILQTQAKEWQWHSDTGKVVTKTCPFLLFFFSCTVLNLEGPSASLLHRHSLLPASPTIISSSRSLWNHSPKPTTLHGANFLLFSMRGLDVPLLTEPWFWGLPKQKNVNSGGEVLVSVPKQHPGVVGWAEKPTKTLPPLFPCCSFFVCFSVSLPAYSAVSTHCW